MEMCWNVQRNFFGSPEIKTSPSNVEAVGWISTQGAKIPCAKNQNVTQKQYYNKFNKDLKMYRDLLNL